MIRIYFAALIGAAIFLSYFVGVHVANIRCNERIASAVAIIVKEPPPSILRAAPKNRFGRYNAYASTPPVKTLPLDGTHVLYARPKRVIESSKITTSCPASTKRFAFSSTILAIFT